MSFFHKIEKSTTLRRVWFFWRCFFNAPISCKSLHIFFNKIQNSSFYIHRKWLAIWSSVNFQIVHCPASLSTLIAIDSSSDHFLIFKLCLVLQFIPHSLHLSCHPIICEFSNCVLPCIAFHSLQLTCHQIICDFSNCALSHISSNIIAIDSSLKMCDFLNFAL